MPKTLLAAIFTLLFGILAFDMMGVLVRMLGGSYPILEVSVLRNLFGIVPPILLLWRLGGFASLGKLNQPRYHVLLLLRSVAVLMAQYFFYTSLTKIEFATASALGFTGPLFITALSVPLLGHVVGWWRWAAIVIGFVGMLTVLKPFDADFSIYMVYPIIAAFGYACSSLLVRFYPAEIPSAAIQLAQQICTCSMAALALFLFDTPVPIASMGDAGLFVLVGVFGGVGILCLVSAYRLTDPSSISPFEYFGIPISFALGWLFYDEAPFDDLFPGILFIIAAGLVIVYRERKANQMTSAATKGASR